jgi:filamentous hemagglutinin
LNNRTVYRGADGKIYSLDTQHGEFELINPRTGQHEGAVQIFGLARTFYLTRMRTLGQIRPVTA